VFFFFFKLHGHLLIGIKRTLRIATIKVQIRLN